MELTPIYIASQVLTVAMYVTLAITYYLKDRRTILIINFLGCVLIGSTYFLLSAWTGVAMSLIAIIRNVIFLVDEKRNGKSEKISKKDILILVIIYFATIIATVPSYKGLLSLLSVFATSLYTFSVWQKKTLVYKILGIPIGLLWISYNIYVMSLFGIILESVLLVFAMTGFTLEYKKSKKKVNEK